MLCSGCCQALTLRDVAELLAGYKELALKYETLSQVRGCDLDTLPCPQLQHPVPTPPL